MSAAPARQPARRESPRSGLGVVVGAVALAAAGAVVAGRAARRRSGPLAEPALRRRGLVRARQGAAALSLAALADSALEHYRGDYRRRPMYAAPAMGALSLAADLAEPRPAAALPATAAHGAAMATGAAGLGLHLRNVARRPGGFSLNNLFYAAPLGAPGALLVAGALGLLSRRIGAASTPEPATVERHGREAALFTAGALAGQTAEVALLHLRGAFHDPFMWLPVTIPPLAAVGLAAEAARPDSRRRRTLRPLLHIVRALGVLGVGFHVYGVSRNMGGWGNWRQTALQGPPTPAPIGFLGLGQSGLAALDLLDSPEAKA